MTVEEVAMAMAEEMDQVRLLVDCWSAKATTRPLFLWVRWTFSFLVIIRHTSWHSFLAAIGTSEPDFSFLWFATSNIDLTRYPHPDQIERSYVIDHVIIADLPVLSYTTFVAQLACSASPVCLLGALARQS